jgi:hypothetical protein
MIASQPVQGCLAFTWHGPGCRAAADEGELCAPPEPVLCPAATDLGQWPVATAGRAGECHIRPGAQ